MKQLKVADVMTSEVVSVGANTDFKTVARLLVEHRVNQLPVVDDEHRVIGLVSEADLLAKPEWQGRRQPGRLESWILEDDIEKASATIASEMMTKEVSTTRASQLVTEAAREMRLHHRKALPVVDEEDRLVGIVSRADLLRAFVRPDDAIRADIESLITHDLSLETRTVTVDVAEGRVTLEGKVESESLRRIVETVVVAVPGVVTVFNGIEAAFDDTHLPGDRTEPADNLSYSGPPLH